MGFEVGRGYKIVVINKNEVECGRPYLKKGLELPYGLKTVGLGMGKKH